MPWTRRRARRHLEPRRGRDGDARRRRGRGRRARLRLGADDAARGRLVPDEDRRRRGRRRPRRRQHDAPTSRSASGTTGWSAATSRSCSRFWPTVRSALDWVVSQQLPWGGINWTPTEDFALLTGSSSIYQSLRAGVALADLLDDPQPEWELAGGRLGHAVREHRDLFEDKSTHSMDWYYPVLGGAVRGRDAFELLESPLGRLRRARPRHPLRRHQPVGDRRRDLRAGDGARRARRPPPRADAARGHAAPARGRRSLLDRLGLRRRQTGTTASRATSTGRSSTRRTPPPR